MKPSRVLTFDIQVYPLVAKFLAHHYQTRPFEVSNVSNPYSSYLYACLDRYDHRDTQQLQPRKKGRLTATLTIGVSRWRVKSFASGQISAHKVSCFNDFVKQMFFEKLTHEVALRTALGMGLKAATERFLKRYELSEDELSIDTALRYYARWRRKMLQMDHSLVIALECCPDFPPQDAVILPHERDHQNGQVESGWRQVA